MSDASPVLGLPFIQPAQAQKHVTHNEALRLLDVMVQLAVLDRTRSTAPTDPAVGDRHIVAAGATGEWAGRDGEIAFRETEGWAFLAPLPGFVAYVMDEGRAVAWTGSAWQSAADLPARFPELGVNTTADATSRLAVAAAASLFTHAGSGGHQLKLNKALAADTASLLFQTGYSGRAEMGTAGSDQFAVKVSPDGAAWFDAFRADGADGRARLPGGLRLPDGSAATPALAFDNDADTGFWRPAADQIGLVAGATTRAVLSGTAFQIDVAVTGTAAQATASDATAGRLLKNGAHGIGGAVVALPGTTDLKDRALPGGNYSFVGSVVPGGPEASAYFYSLLVLHGGDGRRQFLCWRNQTSGAVIVWFGQQATDGTGAITWTRAITHANLLGTVSQSGGVPTGAVLERGSNANGHYLRLACGTQICRHSLALGSIKAAGTGTRADPFRTAATTWTFPAAFIAAPVVTGDAWNATTVATRIACSLNAQVAPTTTAVPLIAFRNTDDATDDSMTAMAVAVGLWI